MTLISQPNTFHGLPVVDFEVGMDVTGIDPSAVAWRVGAADPDNEWGETNSRWLDQRWRALIAQPWAGDIAALMIGTWDAAEDEPAPIAALVTAADRLTRLTGIYIGDVDEFANDISWIDLTDLAEIPRAYPHLRRLWAGGVEPHFEQGTYPALEDLSLRSASIPGSTVRAIGESSLPALTHLELWLGVLDRLPGDPTVDDLAPIFAGTRLPALTTLALYNSEIADQIATALAGAPIVAQLSTLDLSMGTLTDTGAAALLAGQPLTHLTKLDLQYHYLSDDMMRRLRDELEPHGVDIDLSEAQGDENDPEERYVAMSL